MMSPSQREDIDVLPYKKMANAPIDKNLGGRFGGNEKIYFFILKSPKQKEGRYKFMAL